MKFLRKPIVIEAEQFQGNPPYKIRGEDTGIYSRGESDLNNVFSGFIKKSYERFSQFVILTVNKVDVESLQISHLSDGCAKSFGRQAFWLRQMDI